MFGKEVLLTTSQVEKINSLVPKQFRKESWNKKECEHKKSEHNNNKKGVIVFFLSTYLHQVRHGCVVGDG